MKTKQEIAAEELKPCNHLFPRDEIGFKDKNGCHKPNGHYDAHECIVSDGRTLKWEYDLECNCGCMDSDTFEDCCIVYNLTSASPETN